jgi:hypothetical protein
MGATIVGMDGGGCQHGRYQGGSAHEQISHHIPLRFFIWGIVRNGAAAFKQKKPDHPFRNGPASCFSGGTYQKKS